MFGKDDPNNTTPEEYTENLMIKLNAENEEKVSKEVFLKALSNDPKFSKYFTELCGVFSQTAIRILPDTFLYLQGNKINKD
jgi:hypothetical protein